MSTTALLRVRFPLDVVARLDALAAQIGSAIKSRVPRAALIRALVTLGTVEPSPDLSRVIMADAIKRGRGAKRGAS